jgi:2-polyprenyl-3-methyl-5-hydroxy-6-metoxy-1,4-benzoquinol methylase
MDSVTSSTTSATSATSAPRRDTGYRWADATHDHSHAYLLPSVERNLAALGLPDGQRRVFDLGCGNGSVDAHLAKQGYEVVGVDPSEEGIEHGRKAYPHLKLHAGSCYDDLAAAYGRFPALVSLEVVEHVYYPRRFAATAYDLLQPGGVAIISTPYHGYWKNLALALAGKLDDHFTALWDHGHIKFWSMRTLAQLLTEAGFRSVRFERVGRIAALAKSMIAIATR